MGDSEPCSSRLFSVEKFSPTYNLPGSRGGKRRNQQYYLFGGIGATYFNPQAKYQDSWVSLRPLMTEGQSKPYSPIALTIPAGFGFRVGIGAQWRIGLEASYNVVFSDYLDDVSGNYLPRDQFTDPLALALSDRSFEVNPNDEKFIERNLNHIQDYVNKRRAVIKKKTEEEKYKNQKFYKNGSSHCKRFFKK